MARNPRRVDAALDQTYRQLPDLQCKGLCQGSCHHVAMSAGERDRARRAGVEIRPDDTPCPALKAGRCSIHAQRPMVCRLWGMTETTPCPYGCVPAGGRLSHEDGLVALYDSFAAGGERMAVGRDEFVRRAAAPVVAAAANRISRGT